jgi:hypothetical protein
VALAVTSEGMRVAGVSRAAVIVERQVMLEIEAIARILAVHRAQTLGDVRPSGCAVGWL